MKFFLDTEFIELGPWRPIELISIGIVAENGSEFYAVCSDYNPSHASDWVTKNVLPFIGDSRPIPHTSIASGIREFVLLNEPVNPEFWGYYADYDWVVFCQIFGAMIDLPKGWPMYCCDLKQWCDQLGNPQLPAQDSTEHNALNDARWNRKAYNFLSQLHIRKDYEAKG